MIRDYTLIALGGALGSVSRFWLGSRLAAWSAFPMGTLLVNASGSFLIGILASLFWQEHALHSSLRAFLVIGFCGGYTTFSTFSFQTLQLMQKGDWIGAALNILGSVLVCLSAVALGVALGNCLRRV